MINRLLVKNTIHDPRPGKLLVVKEDYQNILSDEHPVVEISLPDNIDIAVEGGVLLILVTSDGSTTIDKMCLFDKPLFDIVRHIDSFGVSAKLMTAKHGLYPAVFLLDVSSSVVTLISIENSPFNLQEVIAPNCFYAKNMITDINRKIVLAQELFGDNILDCKYMHVAGDDVFTDRHYLDGTVQILVNVRVKKLYLCVKAVKFLPFHKVQETCFNESSLVRKAAVAYNANVRNANK